MNKIKDLWDNHKKALLLGIGGFFALLLIILIAIILMNIFKKYDYQGMENLMVQATQKYIKQNSELLPTKEDPETTIDYSTLVNGKYIKEMSKISKDASCFGEVTIVWNEDNYYYLPYLSCTNYETQNIRDAILEQEPIVDDDSSGLQDINGYYTYRGEYVNNYLSLANYTWRILKFDENMIYIVLADTINGKTTYVFDDRYNSAINSNKGYNSFENSRILESLQAIYNNDLTNYHKFLLNMDACTHSRSETDTDKSGAIECFSTLKTPIALLSVYDYMNASMDSLCFTSTSRSCANYNYLAGTTNKWWLLNGTNENSYEVYTASQTGALSLEAANGKKFLRIVLAIPSNLIYKSGTGTSNNPYTFYEY